MSVHQKLAIPMKAGGAVPQAGSGGIQIYVPGQEGGGARLQASDGGLAGVNAQTRVAVQGNEGLARLGAAFENAVKTGADIYEKYQAARAQSAFNEYEREEMRQRAELNGLEGGNALGEDGIRARLDAWRRDAREKYADGLAPMAREMFDRQADNIDARADVWVIGKEQAALKFYENQASEGSILNAREEALMDPANDGAMARSAGIIQAEYERMGQRNGWDKEYTKAKTSEAVRSLNGQRIDSMIDMGDLSGAERAIKGANQAIRVDTGKMPRDHVEYAIKEAKRLGEDPNIVLAQIMQESGGNQKSVSNKGCIGYMQLHPKTAKDLGVNPYDPYQNITGGIRYKQQLRKEFGTEENAFIAYNWGPGNFRAYQKTGRGSKGQARPKESLEYVDRVYARMGNSMLLPGEAGKLQNRIDNKRKQQAAEAKRARLEQEAALAGDRDKIKARLDDSIAALEDGLAPKDLPNASELRFAFGKKAEKAQARLDAAQNYSASLNMLPELDTEHQLQLLKENRPAPGEGYAVKARNYDMLVRAQEADQKKRKEDPAAYVIGHDADLSAASAAFMENAAPETWAAYRARLDAGLAKRGMPADKKLSKPMAAAMAEAFQKAPDKPALMQHWQKAMGPQDFFAAQAQIFRDADDTTRIALAVAGSSDPAQKKAGRALFEIQSDKDFLKNAKQVIPKWNELGDKLIDQSVAKVCAPFNETLLAGQYGNMPEMAVKAQESVKKLGASIALNEGTGLVESMEKAADLILNDRYHFNKVNGRAFRVPKSAYLDNDRIVNGAGVMLKEVAENSADYYTLGGEGFRDGGKNAFKDMILSQGYWITDEKEGGLKLFVNGTAVFWASGENRGKPVAVPWQQLMDLSKEYIDDWDY